MDISLFGTLRKLKLSSSTLRVDDDFVDRLNHYYSGVVILVFTIIISAKQYVGQPLQCWVPAQFSSAMEQYAENFCWVQSTYWLPMENDVPRDIRERDGRKLNYYQWVPFVLIIQAFLFYIPCIVWRLMNWQSGINVQSIVRLACDAQNIDADKRYKVIQSLSRHIQDAIHAQRQTLHFTTRIQRVKARVANLLCCFCWGKRFGNYLVSLYLFIKLLYIANGLGQFFLLNHFLGTSNPLYGPQILSNLINGIEWPHTGIFPRVTLCDFEIRVLANVQRHTVQCVLMINLFNEKIFIFLWFWIFGIAFVTVASLMYWIYRILVGASRYQFVLKYLQMMPIPPSTTNTRTGPRHPVYARLNKIDRTTLVPNFVTKYLRMDGVFVLRLIALNAGDIITADVIAQLWTEFKTKKTAINMTMMDEKAYDESSMIPQDVV